MTPSPMGKVECVWACGIRDRGAGGRTAPLKARIDLSEKRLLIPCSRVPGGSYEGAYRPFSDKVIGGRWP